MSDGEITSIWLQPGQEQAGPNFPRARFMELFGHTLTMAVPVIAHIIRNLFREAGEKRAYSRLQEAAILEHTIRCYKCRLKQHTETMDGGNGLTS